LVPSETAVVASNTPEDEVSRVKLLFVYTHKNVVEVAANRIHKVIPRLAQRDEIHVLIPAGDQSHAFTTRLGTVTPHFFREQSVLGKSLAHFSDHNPSLLRAVRRLATQERPDAIYVPYPWGVPGIARAAKGIPVIYETSNVESRMFLLNTYYSPVTRALLRRYIQTQERQACSAASLIIGISDKDLAWYSQNYGIASSKMLYLPPGVPLEEYTPRRAKAEYKRELGLRSDVTHVLFHGSFIHPPNAEARKLIREFIAPRFRSDARVEFLLAGPGLSPEISGNVRSLGFVPSLNGLLQAADLAIVPIPAASGTRSKMVDYLAAGLPMVSTIAAAQGLQLTDRREAFIHTLVDDDFCESVRVLCADEELRGQMAKAARDLAVRYHDLDDSVERIRAAISTVARTSAPPAVGSPD